MPWISHTGQINALDIPHRVDILRNVEPDLDTYSYGTCIHEIIFQKDEFEKNQQTIKKVGMKTQSLQKEAQTLNWMFWG